MLEAESEAVDLIPELGRLRVGGRFRLGELVEEVVGMIEFVSNSFRRRDRSQLDEHLTFNSSRQLPRTLGDLPHRGG